MGGRGRRAAKKRRPPASPPTTLQRVSAVGDARRQRGTAACVEKNEKNNPRPPPSPCSRFANVPEFWGRDSPYHGGTEFLGTPANHLDVREEGRRGID